MPSLKFRHKMILPAGAVVLASLLAGAVTLALSNRASLELARVEREHGPQLERLRELETLLAQLHRALQAAASTEDRAGLLEADGLAAELGRRIGAAQAAGLEARRAEALRAHLDEHVRLARAAAERQGRGEKGEPAPAAAVSAREAALRAELAELTAQARAAMSGGFAEARRLQGYAGLLGSLILPSRRWRRPACPGGSRPAWPARSRRSTWPPSASPTGISPCPSTPARATRSAPWPAPSWA
jgi:hypothetical protein